MGHESPIELWSPNLTTFCFAGFGTDRLRHEEAMKTASRRNPNRWVGVSGNRAHGAAVQNRSCSIKWAGKQENVQPLEMCFFLTSPFIELIGTNHGQTQSDIYLPEGFCRLRSVISTEEYYFKSRECLVQRLLSLNCLRQVRSIL
jgi:hypothetical protein